MLLPFFLVTSLVQDPAAAPAAPKSDLKVLNGIYLVVNEEAVTMSDFGRALRRRGEEVSSKEDEQRLALESHYQFVREMLMTQAGRDLGFDPARVKAAVDEDLKKWKDNVGSALGLGTALQQQHMEPQEFREDREDFYYRLLWDGAVSGESGAAAGRPSVDKFVRPGRLWLEYRRQPIDQIAPKTFRLQQLVVGVEREGSAEAALKLAQSLRQRGLDGEDFGALVEKFSIGADKAKRGIIPNRVELKRAKAVIPELAEFFDSAITGDISEPIPSRPNGELEAFLLMRVIDVEQPPTEFESLAVQNLLSERIGEQLLEWRRDHALIRLFESSYVWPPQAKKPAEPQVSSAPAKSN